jgi:DNA-binding transcriptional ArsR family regulator
MDEQERLFDRSIELTDPRAMRAYAHPVRLALIGLLRQHGPLTATQAAERLGESSGTCSFHLRQLAKYGFCEEAGGGKGREKPWRATAMSTTWETAAGGTELADAEQHLNMVVLQRYVDLISRWMADRDQDPPEWQKAAGFGDLAVSLTPEELEQLQRGIQALVRPYVPRITGDAEPPPGARRVTLVGFAFPDREDRP